MTLAACGAPGAAAGDSGSTRAVSPDEAPEACALVTDDVLADAFDEIPEPESAVLEHDGTTYGRTCLWGDPTGEDGAVGVQVGAPDDTGHDMVRNRSVVLNPTFDLVSIPGAIACMNVAVFPVGGMTGTSVYVRSGGWSVLVAVSGPVAGLDSATRITEDVLDRLGT
jgi:hypothetical protein